MKLNAERTRWSRSYKSALSRHLKSDPPATKQAALRLGRRAAKLGLESLDVAKVHKLAVAALPAPDGASRAVLRKTAKLAKEFFSETIVPIEAVHSGALKKDVHINKLTRAVRRRTKESSVSASRLAQARVERKVAESVLKKIKEQHAALLAQAERLQSDLRNQTRALLSAQEHERSKTSRELRNEIAQILLAIDISLLALKSADKGRAEKTQKDLANARRLVREWHVDMCSNGEQVALPKTG